MTKLVLLFFPLLIAFCAICLYVTAPWMVRSWITRLEHPAYRSFIANGGSTITAEIFTYLSIDASRNDMARGRTLEDLRKQYPFLTPASTFGKGTYKYENCPTDGAVLWLRSKDGFDWCIVIYPDTSKNKLMLVKG